MAFTNIDDPTIFFTPILYTGTGSSQAITGVGFQPDWVWAKQRNEARAHSLYDVVRGVQKELKAEGSDAESTASTFLTAFGSDGFTMGGSDNVNGSSKNYVAWCWNAGGSASSNGNGSITSSVSVNTTAGFSVGTYNANATAGATVGHGLGAAPEWLLVKVRNNTNNWGVFHTSMGATKAMYLDQTSSETTDGWLNNTAPGANVFTLSGGNYGNASGYEVVFYAFTGKQGYSKFGQYVGNGNADGPFVYTGFKPAFVMIKPQSYSNSWGLFDNKRPGFNVTKNRLEADNNSAENTNLDYFDFLSNGFKVRTSNSHPNNSGGTIIYAAFAESPFVNSNGIPNNAR